MYISTRGGEEQLTAAQAILKGIAGNGGLYVPEDIPAIDSAWIANLQAMDYCQRAQAVLSLFLTDYSADELVACIQAAYGADKFDTSDVAPVVKLAEDSSILELWHGPTSAFKDMALQLLPHLLSLSLKKSGEKAEVVILVATSGDTGKAALEGFKDVNQIRIIVFYPQDGVSEIQRLQMVTQEGGNVSVVAVTGNFDDTQTGVKQIFNDTAFNARLAAQGHQFSSANSINWGRLVPQIVYYFSAYADMLKAGTISAGEKVNFVVPTGNFGNILAGYYAYRMGLPINKLICAANNNNVLAEFLQTGRYDRRREFHKTLSPSMDILISSNLERLLYHVTGQDTARVDRWMRELTEEGFYQVDETVLTALQSLFWADWSSDQQTTETIAAVYNKFGYTCDPHTAVAWEVCEKYRQQTADPTKAVILSTASPFKFNTSVVTALQGTAEEANEFVILEQLSRLSGWPIPKQLAELEQKQRLHSISCKPEEMAKTVQDILQNK